MQGGWLHGHKAPGGESAFVTRYLAMAMRWQYAHFHEVERGAETMIWI